jgi:hypothetical protein
MMVDNEEVAGSNETIGHAWFCVCAMRAAIRAWPRGMLRD